MPKAPVVSWVKVAKLLEQLGYRLVRQEGSHKGFELEQGTGSLAGNAVTVPEKDPVLIKTLNRILKTVEAQTGVPKKQLIEMLCKI